MTTKNILITRELREGSLIRKWAVENKLNLIEKSFIQTVAVTDAEIPETDWIFFSSPQSVQLYFENYSLHAKKIAALSEGTAGAVSQQGQTASFIGDSAQSTKQIGSEFFNRVTQNEIVLFPLSDISKRNVSSQNADQEVIEIITYKTVLNAEKLAEDPILVLFTSPSNVDGFLLKNKLTDQTKILAIGETTASQLRYLGFTKIGVSESTNEKALVKALKTLF